MNMNNPNNYLSRFFFLFFKFPVSITIISIARNQDKTKHSVHTLNKECTCNKAACCLCTDPATPEAKPAPSVTQTNEQLLAPLPALPP